MYANSIGFLAAPREISSSIRSFDFDNYYDLNRGQPIKTLSIKIGSNELPRFQCANHKLNLAIRRAIDLNDGIKEVIRLVNASNAHVRRSVQLNRVFRENKSRLRIENLTRWSSAYLLLESTKRAYDNNMFNENNSEATCPVDLRTIEIYLQILKPAYLLSLAFQLSSSSIADTIPSILKLIHTYEHLDTQEAPRELCSLLIETIKAKFDFELNSDVYKAASILKVSGLKYWLGRQWSTNAFTSGIKALKFSIKHFLFNKHVTNSTQNNSSNEQVNLGTLSLNENNSTSPNLSTPHSASNNFYSSFFNSDANYVQTELENEIINDTINKEVDSFQLLLSQDDFGVLKSIKSTRLFWEIHRQKFPNLFQLALILLNINSSSACIERYFSICGFVSKKRTGNITNELFITRCILRANMDILKDLSKVNC